MRLILASSSPARLSTLRMAGLDPEVIVSSVDEEAYSRSTSEDLVTALATAKAESVFASLEDPCDVIVVGCDSVLDFNGEPVGKPGSAEAAAHLLRRTQGKSGVLHTGHHVIVSMKSEKKNPESRMAHTERRTHVGRTTVHVGHMTDEEIGAYISTGEPLHVAGGFTIDGLGGAFIDGVDGDPHNVIGISLPLLRAMLGELGVCWTDLWSVRSS